MINSQNFSSLLVLLKNTSLLYWFCWKTWYECQHNHRLPDRDPFDWAAMPSPWLCYGSGEGKYGLISIIIQSINKTKHTIWERKLLKCFNLRPGVIPLKETAFLTSCLLIFTVPLQKRNRSYTMKEFTHKLLLLEQNTI